MCERERVDINRTFMRSHIDFSIAKGKRVDKKLCYSQTYGGISSIKMNQLIFLTFAFLVLYSNFVAGEFSGIYLIATLENFPS